MTTWFYINENGEKIEVTGGQLKGLAKAGRITPETMVGTEGGKTAPARKVKGLKFATPAQSVESESIKVVATPSYFFIDANGLKQGPVSDLQLKALAERGVILPDTLLETDTGHKGKAGQIRGLFNEQASNPFTAPTLVSNQTIPQSVSVPAAEKSSGSSWQVTVIGAVLILIVGGIAWKIFEQDEQDRPPNSPPLATIEAPANETPSVQERFIEPNPFLNVLPSD